MERLTKLSIILSIIAIGLWLAVFCFLLPDKPVDNTVFYISESGDDNNTGHTRRDAWKTIDKINATDFEDNSRVLFKRGEKFVGNVNVPDNMITYGAFGIGEKPKIYGSEIITGWEVFSEHIYKATLDKPVTQLFVDDERMLPARYPNVDEAMFKISSVRTGVSFISGDLNPDFIYAGSKVHFRTNAWRFDGRDVALSDGNSLTIDSELPYGGIKAGMEFFLVDNLDFLDSYGEWYSDGSVIYLWVDTPSKQIIRGSTFREGFSIDTKNHITVENLNILQQQEAGLIAEDCSFLVVDNCDFSNQEARGIKVIGNENLITNNTVSNVNYVALSCSGGNSIVLNNVITDIGQFENLGINGIAGNASAPYGMSLGGDNNIIKYNQIINVGYLGISFTGHNTLIKNNLIKNNNNFLTDGGAIYTYSKNVLNDVAFGSVIDGNIIVNSGHNGIYGDNNTNNIEIKNNTIIESVKIGLFFHENYEVYAHHNTLFKNETGIRSSALALPDGKLQNRAISNIILAREDDGAVHSLVALFSSALEPRTAFLDSNIYISHYFAYPFKDLNGYVIRSFDSWKIAMECDFNSMIDNSDIGSREEFIFYNATRKDSVIDLKDGDYKDISGNPVSELVLLPFESKILLK